MLYHTGQYFPMYLLSQAEHLNKENIYIRKIPSLLLNLQICPFQVFCNCYRAYGIVTMVTRWDCCYDYSRLHMHIAIDALAANRQQSCGSSSSSSSCNSTDVEISLTRRYILRIQYTKRKTAAFHVTNTISPHEQEVYLIC